MRESSAGEGVLTLGAFLLFAVAAAALVVLVRRAGRFGKAGKVGTVLAMVGVSVLVLVSLVQALIFDGDFRLMPHFVRTTTAEVGGAASDDPDGTSRGHIAPQRATRILHRDHTHTYNHHRPHSALGYMTPAAFAAAWTSGKSITPDPSPWNAYNARDRTCRHQ